MSRVVVGSIVVALVLVGTQFSPRVSQAQTPDTVSYFQFIDAMNQGNVTRALAAFADDAAIEGFPPLCLDSCKGKAAIQRQFEFETGAKINLQMLGTLQQTGPSTFSVVVSHRADLIRAAGLSRVLFKETATFNNQGKISKLAGEPDFADTQTATFAFLLTQPQPAPGAAAGAPTVASGALPAAAATGITPPSTGDAGLASRETKTLYMAIASVVILVAAAGALGAFKRI